MIGFKEENPNQEGLYRIRQGNSEYEVKVSKHKGELWVSFAWIEAPPFSTVEEFRCKAWLGPLAKPGEEKAQEAVEAPTQMEFDF